MVSSDNHNGDLFVLLYESQAQRFQYSVLVLWLFDKGN